MSLAVRIKLGGWWKNTVCFMLICLIWKAVKWLWSLLIRILGALLRGIRKVFGFFRDLIRGIPTIWKGMLVIAVISFAELVLYESSRYDGESVFIAWFVLHLITIPAGMYILLMDLRLKKGADALAAGDLSNQIDSKYMIADYRAHAKSLNSIGEGLARAVEQRTKSERFRTELITNVSHDIKTPLTSIINYSELIGKVLDSAENGGETDNSGEAAVDTEKLREYSGVLGRQSDKLKRLLDDLVEASKASTGNLDVQLAPCDAAVFVDQAEGEYSEKLSAAGLALITSKPQTPVRIMADGRRMWRVFDNLINNACKYSQPGTRVYLSLDTGGQEAVFTLRSTSREPLNISADELMERFVRGDRSRSSEGSGLGLSIARSLTELQKGSFGIAVDGDLFKAVLRFPLL
jgi:signal transduction histidine kinase